MKSMNRWTIACVAVAVTVGLVVWRQSASPGSRTNNSIGRVGSESQNDQTRFALSVNSLPGSALGQSLAELLPTTILGFAASESDRFRHDCKAWLSAYTATSADSMRTLMTETDVIQPPSWNTQEGVASSWNGVGEIFNRIGFEATAPAIIKHKDRESDLKRYEGRSMRCGRRDDARLFLRNSASSEVEIRFDGYVLDTDSNTPVPVQVSFTFAWNPDRERWIVVGTCLLDFPNSISNAYALLL